MTYHVFWQLEVFPSWTELAVQQYGEPGGPADPELALTPTELDWLERGLVTASFYHPCAVPRIHDLRRGRALRAGGSPAFVLMASTLLTAPCVLCHSWPQRVRLPASVRDGSRTVTPPLRVRVDDEPRSALRSVADSLAEFAHRRACVCRPVRRSGPGTAVRCFDADGAWRTQRGEEVLGGGPRRGGCGGAGGGWNWRSGRRGTCGAGSRDAVA